MKIAIIEDDRELNLLIKKILEKEGFEVNSFFEGESLIKQNKNYEGL